MIDADGALAVVQDADSGEFSRPPALQFSLGSDVLCLSGDGASALLMSPTGSVCRIGRHDFASGREQWVSVPSSTWVPRAAAMVDPGMAAVLAETWDASDPEDADGAAVITMVNLETGHCEAIYSAPGWPAAESTVTVSPDALYIAATYAALPDDPDEVYSHTIVVDLRGRLLRHLRGAQIVPQGNTGWLNRSHVACELSTADGMPEPELAAIDVFSGRRRPLRSSWRRPIARIGDRFLFEPTQPTGTGPRLETVALRGEDWTPFLTVEEPSLIMHVDVAAVNR
ncbi:hypothetical protein [Asanoa ishikariensis]|nr:hypothetical protein [Asanoa ishikariensis]